MTPEGFRRDRYLRSTGYNFYVFAAVNLLVTLPLFAALDGKPWPAWLGLLYPVAVLGAGFVAAGLNDNRVGKMCGEPSPEPAVEAGYLWGPVFLLGVLLTALFVVRGPVAYVQPLWLLLVGAAYMQWGNFTIREFQLFGLVLVVAGIVSGFSIRPDEVPPGMPSRSALIVWVIFMGVVWIPFGAYINRKYVH
ncbi:MAG: hypothetical protein ACREQ9_21185, partial [Candidatus Binatia bacterium]